MPAGAGSTATGALQLLPRRGWWRPAAAGRRRRLQRLPGPARRARRPAAPAPAGGGRSRRCPGATRTVPTRSRRARGAPPSAPTCRAGPGPRRRWSRAAGCLRSRAGAGRDGRPASTRRRAVGAHGQRGVQRGGPAGAAGVDAVARARGLADRRHVHRRLAGTGDEHVEGVLPGARERVGDVGVVRPGHPRARRVGGVDGNAGALAAAGGGAHLSARAASCGRRRTSCGSQTSPARGSCPVRSSCQTTWTGRRWPRPGGSGPPCSPSAPSRCGRPRVVYHGRAAGDVPLGDQVHGAARHGDVGEAGEVPDRAERRCGALSSPVWTGRASRCCGAAGPPVEVKIGRDERPAAGRRRVVRPRLPEPGGVACRSTRARRVHGPRPATSRARRAR